MRHPSTFAKMKKAFVSSIAVFMVAAKATAPQYTSLDQRSDQGEPGGVYFCNEPYFTGHCWWTSAGLTPSQCEVTDDDFDSFGPDAGALCAIFDEQSCVGNTVIAASPGIFNLNAMGWGYPRPKSYICWVLGSRKDFKVDNNKAVDAEG